jgi:hypothetical protein
MFSNSTPVPNALVSDARTIFPLDLCSSAHATHRFNQIHAAFSHFSFINIFFSPILSEFTNKIAD